MISTDLDLVSQRRKKTVVFHDLKPIFCLDESILVEFTVTNEISATSADWVGLLPLNWTSVQQYITFEWVSDSLPSPWGANGLRGVVLKALLFCAQYHAHAVGDHTLYQFVYVSKQIEVLGVSAAFKFDVSNTIGELPCSTHTLAQITELCPHSSSTFSSSNNEGYPTFDWNTEVAKLRKENNVLEQRCRSAETAAALASKHCQAFMESMIESLEKHQAVQLLGRGKQIWVKKVDKPERKVQISRAPRLLTQKQLLLQPGIDKVSLVVSALRKLCRSAESQLKSAAELVRNFCPTQLHILPKGLEKRLQCMTEILANLYIPVTKKLFQLYTGYIEKKEEEDVFFDAQSGNDRVEPTRSSTQIAARLQNIVIDFMSNNTIANEGSFEWNKSKGRWQIEFKKGRSEKLSEKGDGNKIETEIQVPPVDSEGDKIDIATAISNTGNKLPEHEILKRNLKFFKREATKNGHFWEID